MPDTPSQTLDRRRSLRQSSTTPEQLLWAAIRNRQANNLKFRRQHAFGRYIVDFACLSANLIVELDSQYHADLNVAQKDKDRQAFLERQGFTVLRFTNQDVLADVDAVVIRICEVAGKPPHPHPNPLPHRVVHPTHAIIESNQTTRRGRRDIDC